VYKVITFGISMQSISGRLLHW